MSYDVYWVKNRAEKIADFEHPTLWDCKSWVDGRIAVRNHKSGGLNLILTSNFFKQMKTLILI